MVYDANTIKFGEWIEESVFGTFPTNPAMKGFGGQIQGITLKGGHTFEEYNYLVPPATADPLGASDAEMVGQEITIDGTMKPTDWSILPAILSSDSLATYAVGDTKNYISVGLVAGAEYAKVAGCYFSNYSCKIIGRKIAESKFTLKGAYFTDWSGTDYKGTGSHSVVPSSPLTKVTGVLYDSAALSSAGLILDSITLNIEQPADPVVDPSATNDSQIVDWDFDKRKIGVEFGVSATNMNIDDDLWDGSAHTLAFAGLGKTITLSNILWEAPDRQLDAADKMGLTLKSKPVCGIAMA